MGIADTDGWHAEFIIPGENTNQLAILFTIAHELGHLNWRNAWNKNPDPSACFKSLLGLSWSSTVDGNGVDARARPWTDYGDDVGLHKGSIPKPHQATPAKLRTIYKGGFITALAAANQEKISWEPIRRC